MHFRKAKTEDCEWIYNALEELRMPVDYSLEQFKTYFEKALNSDFFEFLIFCEKENRVGLVSLNKFYMPRYLGFGYEIEEFVVHKGFRGKGLSYIMIEKIKGYLSADIKNRKLSIKTNGEDSKHIYTKALNETDLISYQVYLNKL
ncbi:MAG TPA: GNAT family N-acetyltransferase [Bacteroidia bacterium]|jgi:hypothetical protein|nr:GNAT family N-acetyltransferase [Bacteroidia bacterium]